MKYVYACDKGLQYLRFVSLHRLGRSPDIDKKRDPASS